jgi:hypothetical protein
MPADHAVGHWEKYNDMYARENLKRSLCTVLRQALKSVLVLHFCDDVETWGEAHRCEGQGGILHRCC